MGWYYYYTWKNRTGLNWQKSPGKINNQRGKRGDRLEKIYSKHALQTSHSPFREEILEMDHLHHDGNILLRSGAEVVFDVALSLELEHHLFDGHTLPADTAELVP